MPCRSTRWVQGSESTAKELTYPRETRQSIREYDPTRDTDHTTRPVRVKAAAIGVQSSGNQVPVGSPVAAEYAAGPPGRPTVSTKSPSGDSWPDVPGSRVVTTI